MLFSQDNDLLVEASRCQAEGVPFCGVIYGHQLRLTVGEAIADLELIAGATTVEELLSQVLYSPL